MIHYRYLTEQFTRSYGPFGAMVLTFRPSIVGGYSCVATIHDSVIRDIFRDLGREYPDSEQPEEDLKRVIDYVLANGRFFDENGEEVDEYTFYKTTGY